ncbi:MAG: preprotein translocase subunit YajC [Planctomycetota bacterium]
MDWSPPSAWSLVPAPQLLAQADDAPPPGAAPSANPDGGAGSTASTTADGSPATGETQDTSAGPFGSSFLFIMILVVGMLFIFSMSGGRKEKKRRAAMLEQLKKGAKVQTAGGVLGTVVEVRDDEVLVKVDENSNTRMRFAKTAISAVLED